ncbi:unnamed protein product [Aphanomyces euteiches]
MRRTLEVVLAAAAVVLAHGGHDCMHDYQLNRFERSVNLDTLTNEQVLETPGSRRLADASTLFQPIRISFDVSKLTSDPGYLCSKAGDVVTRDGSSYTCTQNDLLTKDKADFIITVLLPAVKNYFSNVLSVQPVVGPLIISGIGCQSNEWACCASSIPSYLSKTGVANTDFIIHVTARPTSGAVLAWALPCNIDQYGRPISGQANFGPNRLDTQAASRAGQIGTAIHEITHALAFSSSRFGDFRQPLNGPQWGSANVISQTQQNGIYVTKLITPQVVKQVKLQYNCPNWPGAGAELENGPTGSSGYSSHWEKRLFHNEYMTATSSSNPVFSAITLAFFEDTGWYTANYSMAQTLSWGYLEGCDFATGRCSGWSSDYFCSSASEHCSATRDAKGYCDVTSYTSSIPSGFQYFSNVALGGQDSYSDYCPTYQGYSNGACSDTTTYMDTDLGEELGPASQCFQSKLTKSGSRSSSPACYPVVKCDQRSMYIRVGGQVVACPLAGGEVSVPGFVGTVTCPAANKLCQRLQTQCSGQGILQVDGTCACSTGFHGTDCSRKDCPATNGVSCSGHGTCDDKVGVCTCDAAYTGLACSDLLCPVVAGDKFTGKQCSGHGTCNYASGTCTCASGYSGKACECVPGCTTCQNAGSCDCMTGACICPAGSYGSKCQTLGDAPITTLQLDGGATVQTSVPAKTYAYFKVLLNSSSSDITVVLKSVSGDADLYGSFADTYPGPASRRTSLFISNANRTDGLDEIQLCGTLGEFPRALNDTFRFCSQPNTLLVQGAPGHFYIAVFGFTAATFELHVESDPCVNESCSNHGQCGKSSPPSLFSGLRNSTQCYGNGECVVMTNSKGVEQPTCVCDEAFSYANPTDDQSICKVPIPSIDFIQHFNGPFTIQGTTLDNQVSIGVWAIYTLTIQPSWQFVYVQLERLSDGSDPLLVVRKTKLPSLDLAHPYPLQAADPAAWTSASRIQRVMLTRASSTLTNDLLYIGVYNSRYARNALAFTLTVQTNSTCDGPTTAACGGSCDVATPKLCQCGANATGDFCDLVNIPHQNLMLSQPLSIAPSIVLYEGGWQYLTFDVVDPLVEFVKVELTMSKSNPNIKPLVLVRGPLETGFPSLDLSSAMDFNGTTTADSTSQVVLVPVTTSCRGPQCFKVAIHNKIYSDGVLQANVTISGIASATDAFPGTECPSSTGDDLNCHGRGTCVLVSSQPTCKCKNGWSGVRCNSPRAFAISQLWAAAANITFLCSLCQATFTLANGAVAMYMLPQSMQPNTGLQVRVRASGTSSVSPNIYVSEVLPRSIYDFTTVSFSDASEEVVQLTTQPLEGHFWIAIYSEAPLAMDASTSNWTTFTIESSLLPLNTTTTDKRLITTTSFFASVMTWLTTNPFGIVVLSLFLIFLGLAIFYFIWRTFRAPDNQDSAISTLAADLGEAAARSEEARERPTSPLRSGRSLSDAITPSAPPADLDVELAQVDRI